MILRLIMIEPGGLGVLDKRPTPTPLPGGESRRTDLNQEAADGFR